ncbi:hypothetical protein LINPERPRIM_LOCUS35282, partial [Linum perenne]
SRGATFEALWIDLKATGATGGISFRANITLQEVSLFRCSVEFGGVAGWSCEVKIRKLLW